VVGVGTPQQHLGHERRDTGHDQHECGVRRRAPGAAVRRHREDERREQRHRADRLQSLHDHVDPDLEVAPDVVGPEVLAGGHVDPLGGTDGDQHGEQQVRDRGGHGQRRRPP